jgi:hypothetical protein
MENLVIEETEFTPAISLNAETRIFSFTGVSRPENVLSFYQPVFDWLSVYEKEVLSKIEEAFNAVPLKMIFHFSYFNSSSSKMILQILEFFVVQREKGINVEVDYYYDDGDDQMEEDGEELSEVMGIPFNFIKI